MPNKKSPPMITVFGATSFVGELVCEYMLQRHGTDGSSGIRWQMAGRSEEKLRATRTRLGNAAIGLSYVLADAADRDSLKSMCAQSDVILTTVGPYAEYGSALLEVCAETGTDYCDLTGEIQWVRKMLDDVEERAEQSGARIINCAGFDSVPSDLGVYHLEQIAESAFGEPANRVRMRVELQGELSGGTLASMVNSFTEGMKNPAIRRVLVNPYSICPFEQRSGVRQPDVRGIAREADLGIWSAPFLMSPVNTKVVHRSHALLGHPWGDDFLYDEGIHAGEGAKGVVAASAWTVGTLGFVGAMLLPPSRWLMDKFVTPSPGEGPDAQSRADGFFKCHFYGTTASGESLHTTVSSDVDPGYASTAKIISEVATWLAENYQEDQVGGFWTPASLMGDDLIAALANHADIRFEVVEGK